MACQPSLRCQFLSTGVLIIALINQITVKLRQHRQGQTQLLASLTLFQQALHTGFGVWRKRDTRIFVSSPARHMTPSASPMVVRGRPLTGLIGRLYVKNLTPTQLTTPIQGDVFRPHSQPRSEGASLGT